MATAIPTNQAPFTLAEVLAATGGVSKPAAASLSQSLRGVSTDTRLVTPGAIFVALRGEHFDGHRFVDSAAKAGAALAIVDEEQESELPQVIVADTLVALGGLAAFHRRRWGGAIVAIAGAAGKTTTRSLTSALLDEAYASAVHSTPGNLNNRIGVPMVLLGLRDSHRLGVVEVGTNVRGEVEALARMVQPDVAVLTLVALEHSEGLGDLDEIEREEAAIFSDSCRAFVVNGDDTRALRQAQAASARLNRSVTVDTYGFNDGVDLRAIERVTLTPRQTRLRLKRAGGAAQKGDALGPTDAELLLPMVGQPAAYALMAAWLAAEALVEHGLPVEHVQRALARHELQPQGRAEVIELPDGPLLINDSYNANPPSMRAALQTATEISDLRGGKLHLVLGEMRELGALSVSAHAELGVELKTLRWATLCLIGDEMVPALEPLRRLPDPQRVVSHTRDASGVAAVLLSRLGPRDVVLVKGSRGIRTEQVIAFLMSQKAPRP